MSAGSVLTPMVGWREVELLSVLQPFQLLGRVRWASVPEQAQVIARRDRLLVPQSAHHYITQRLVRVSPGSVEPLVGLERQGNRLGRHVDNVYRACINVDSRSVDACHASTATTISPARRPSRRVGMPLPGASIEFNRG